MSLYQFIRDPIERLFRDAEILSLVQSFQLGATCTRQTLAGFLASRL